MQALTVRAILERKREHVYHAAMLDPNTAAHLTLRQIRETLDRLLEAQGSSRRSTERAHHGRCAG
jgi:alpha-galactosidase